MGTLALWPIENESRDKLRKLRNLWWPMNFTTESSLSEVFIIWLQDMVSWLTLVSLDSPVGGWVGLGLGGLGLRTGVSVTETGNWLLGRQTSDGQEAARCFYQLLPRTGCQSCGSLVRRGRQKQDNPDRDKLGQKYTIVQLKSHTVLKRKTRPNSCRYSSIVLYAR